MNALLSIHWLLAGSIWYFANGVLHDIFILKNHQGPYNRDLLRLLMDGHLLIFSGILLFIAYQMAKNNVYYGALIGIVIAISMLVYCFMIFPFLKSFVTMFISIMVMAVCIRLYTNPESI